MTIAARLLQGRKRIYSGQQGLFAAQPMSLRYSAAQKFGFVAPLRTNVFLTRGVGAASFTRATVAAVKDFEGNIRNVLSGEVRFEGQRRVRNLCTSSESTSSWSAAGTTPPTVGITTSFSGDTYAGCTLPTGVNGFAACAAGIAGSQHTAYVAGSSIPDRAWRLVLALSRPLVGSESILIYCTGYAGYFKGITLNSSFCPTSPTLVGVSGDYFIGAAGSSGTNTIYVVPNTNLSTTVSVYAKYVQVENTLGQSNQNPSEYVSVGAAKLNEFTNSEDLTAVASWAPTRTTVTANGYQTLDTVLETAVVNTHELASATISGIGASTAHRVQFECKPNGRNEAWVQVSDGTQGAYCVFNAATGAFTTAWQGFGPSAFTGCSSTIESRGDGVYRVTLDFTTAASTAAITTTFYLYNAGISYLGDVAKGWYLGKLMLRRGTGDYFAVGNVYPYHGACVDGVKYFDYTNPNRVVSNVVYSDVPTEPCEGYAAAYYPGTASNGFLTAANIDLGLAADARFVFEGVCADWTPSVDGALMAQAAVAGDPNRCFVLWLMSTGKIRLEWCPTGSIASVKNADSSVACGFADGTNGAIQVVIDGDNGASGHTITFYTGPSANGPWTQLGVPAVGVGTTTLPNVAAKVSIGGRAEGSLSPAPIASIKRGQIFNGLTASSPVLDFNPRDGWTENKLTRSGEIQNVAWDKLNTGTGVLPTVTDNYGTAPDGTQTATRVQLDIGAGTLAGDFAAVRQLTTVSGENNTRTMWVKLNSGSPVVVRFFDTLMTTVTDQWQKITFSGSVGSDYRIGQLQGNIATGKAADILIWRPQLRRDFAFGSQSLDQYVPTTTAARRGWYSSTTGEFWDMNGMASLRKTGRPRYLAEGATTNLVLQSSDFSSATWVKAGTPVTTTGAAYCGDIALCLLNDDDGAVAEAYYQPITFTADASKSFSMVIKQGTSTSTCILLYDSTGAAYRFNGAVTWANGVPVVTASTGSQERPPEPLANGGWRIFLLASGVIAANVNRIYVYPAATAGGGTPASTGTIYVGGVQAENATFASSLQPPTTGTAARNADVETYPASGNVSATAGALYMEVLFDKFYSVQQTIFEICDGTLNERYTLLRDASGNILFAVVDGGVIQAGLSLGALPNGTLGKIAVTWEANNFAGCLNGGSVVTDVAGTLPTVTTMYVGTYSAAGLHAHSPIGPVMVAQRKLSGAEIVALSA